MSSNTGEKVRAVFLAAIMVVSVFGMTAAFAGSAAADQETTPTNEVVVDPAQGTGDYSSIQAAINSEGSDTLINVTSGTYSESIEVGVSGGIDNVTIEGAGVGQTILNGTSSDSSAITIGRTDSGSNVEASNISISGFTVYQNKSSTFAVDSSGGTSVTHSNLTIEDNRIVANSSGVSAYFPTATDVRIADNEFAVEGNNNADKLLVGGNRPVETISDGFTIEDNTFIGSTTANVLEVRATDTAVTNNDFTGASSDGAIILDPIDDLDLATVRDGNTFDRTVTVEDSSSGDLTAGIFGSIQPAVDAATSNDIIEASSGTYTESVTITKAGITLQAADGASPTIDGDTSRALTVDVGSGNSLTVDNFTLTRGDAGGEYNVFVDTGELTLRNSTVNIVDASGGATDIGIDVRDAGTLTVEDSVFNVTEFNGDNDAFAIRLSDSSDDGSADGTTITDTEFKNLYLGVQANGVSDITVNQSSFNNLSEDSLYLFTNQGEIDGLNVANNSFTDTGSGVGLAASTGDISNVDIDDNLFVKADTSNDAVYVTESGGSAETVDATSNWWGSTDGPSGAFSGHGVSVGSGVTVDPVTVDAGEANLTAKFIGIVKDDASRITVRADANAGFNIEELDEPANGTLVVDIAGQEYVFTDALDNGEVVETDSSQNSSTDIAVTTTPGPTNISVVGYDDATAIEQTGEVDLAHEVRNAPQDSGYFLTSMPQSGQLLYQDIKDITQWDGVDDEYQSFDDSNEVDSVHRGLYMNAASADARYGFIYDTDQSDIRDQTGSKELDEGWHVLSSNYNISDSPPLNLRDDLSTQSAPSNSDLVVYDDSVTTIFGDSTNINEYDAYYVYVHQSDTRPIVLPEYNATAR